MIKINTYLHCLIPTQGVDLALAIEESSATRVLETNRMDPLGEDAMSRTDVAACISIVVARIYASLKHCGSSGRHREPKHMAPECV